MSVDDIKAKLHAPPFSHEAPIPLPDRTSALLDAVNALEDVRMHSRCDTSRVRALVVLSTIRKTLGIGDDA